MNRCDRLPEYQVLTAADKDRIRAEIIANCEFVADCWIYLGARNSDGYGLKRVGDRVHSVSRFMLAYDTRESLNTRLDACHDPLQCPYKACCNPRHLFWATHSKNCRQREQAKREEREMFSFWENHTWIGDPSIDKCIASLNRGKIDRVVTKQSSLLQIPAVELLATALEVPLFSHL
jgi:hypothetical protein